MEKAITVSSTSFLSDRDLDDDSDDDDDYDQGPEEEVVRIVNRVGWGGAAGSRANATKLAQTQLDEYAEGEADAREAFLALGGDPDGEGSLPGSVLIQYFTDFGLKIPQALQPPPAPPVLSLRGRPPPVSASTSERTFTFAQFKNLVLGAQPTASVPRGCLANLNAFSLATSAVPVESSRPLPSARLHTKMVRRVSISRRPPPVDVLPEKGANKKANTRTGQLIPEEFLPPKSNEIVQPKGRHRHIHCDPTISVKQLQPKELAKSMANLAATFRRGKNNIKYRGKDLFNPKFSGKQREKIAAQVIQRFFQTVVMNYTGVRKTVPGAPIGTLIARIVSVSDVCASEGGLNKVSPENANPYIQLTMDGNLPQMTTVKHKETSPVWRETLLLRVFNTKRRLTIKLLNKESSGRDELIGMTGFNYGRLPRGKAVLHELKLEGPMHVSRTSSATSAAARRASSIMRKASVFRAGGMMTSRSRTRSTAGGLNETRSPPTSARRSIGSSLGMAPGTSRSARTRPCILTVEFTAEGFGVKVDDGHEEKAGGVASATLQDTVLAIVRNLRKAKHPSPNSPLQTSLNNSSMMVNMSLNLSGDMMSPHLSSVESQVIARFNQSFAQTSEQDQPSPGKKRKDGSPTGTPNARRGRTKRPQTASSSFARGPWRAPGPTGSVSPRSPPGPPGSSRDRGSQRAIPPTTSSPRSPMIGLNVDPDATPNSLRPILVSAPSLTHHPTKVESFVRQQQQRIYMNHRLDSPLGGGSGRSPQRTSNHVRPSVSPPSRSITPLSTPMSRPMTCPNPSLSPSIAPSRTTSATGNNNSRRIRVIPTRLQFRTSYKCVE